MRTESRVGFILGLVIFFNVLVYVQSVEECQIAQLPANIETRADVARVIHAMARGSATFRGQCERIANSERLRVRIYLDPNIGKSCRAFTVITRRAGIINAEVHVPPSSQLTELLGHEFEHILEQIEGLDLRALARKRGSGVHEVASALFETVRAQLAGRVVAEELRSPRSAPLAD